VQLHHHVLYDVLAAVKKPPTYVLAFLVVSFLLAFPPKAYMHVAIFWDIDIRH
jgi:hypothetical protein